MTSTQNIVERSPFPMAATEGEAHAISYVNSAFCAIHGKQVEELLGRPFAETIPFSIVDNILGMFDRVYLGAQGGEIDSLRVFDAERRISQSYTVWAIPVRDDSAGGLLIRVSDSIPATASDPHEGPAKDEMLEINQRLLISSIRMHETAELAAQANSMLTRAFDRERSIAEALQYTVMGEEPEDIFPGLSVATIYEPALQEALVGGDFFDAINLPNGRIMLVVGDVTGKGLRAAARTVEAKYALRAYAHLEETPAATVARLNDYICRHGGSAPENLRRAAWENNDLIVLLVAVIDAADCSARFVSAGAEPPVIIRASGKVDEVPTRGMLLGYGPGITYAQVRRTLKSGDIVILTTDGITESRRGHTFFGYEGIVKIVKKAAPSQSLHDIGKAIVDAARAFAGGQLHDDVCILLMRCK